MMVSLANCIMFFIARIWYVQTRPWPLPFHGNILSINTVKMRLSFYERLRKYGTVFRVFPLGEEVEVIKGNKYVRNAFLGRENDIVISLLIGPQSLMSKYLMFGVKAALGRANKVSYALQKILRKRFRALLGLNSN